MSTRLRLFTTFLLVCLGFVFWVSTAHRNDAAIDPQEMPASVEQISAQSPALDPLSSLGDQPISTEQQMSLSDSIVESDRAEDAVQEDESDAQETDPTAAGGLDDLARNLRALDSPADIPLHAMRTQGRFVGAEEDQWQRPELRKDIDFSARNNYNHVRLFLKEYGFEDGGEPAQTAAASTSETTTTPTETVIPTQAVASSTVVSLSVTAATPTAVATAPSTDVRTFAASSNDNPVLAATTAQPVVAKQPATKTQFAPRTVEVKSAPVQVAVAVAKPSVVPSPSVERVAMIGESTPAAPAVKSSPVHRSTPPASVEKTAAQVATPVKVKEATPSIHAATPARQSIVKVAPVDRPTPAVKLTAVSPKSAPVQQPTITEVAVWIDDASQLGHAKVQRITDAIATVNRATQRAGINLKLTTAITPPTASAAIILREAGLDELNPGYLGYAEASPSTSSNFGGVASINQNFNWYLGSEADAIAEDQFDYQSVVTHELLHLVGLEDDFETTDVDNDIMADTLSRGVARRTIAPSVSRSLQQQASRGRGLNSRSGALVVAPVVVPEPTTIALLGLSSLAMLRRRR